ncbi:hypothetical protein WEI85_27840 [Actinomycetes bacterium KLBMP 9797]
MNTDEVRLGRALRGAAYSSLVGIAIGVAIALSMDLLNWQQDVAGVAGLGATGMASVPRDRRWRAWVAMGTATAVCLVLGLLLLGRTLPEPWDFFVPLALALAIGSQAGTFAAYRRPNPSS